MRSNLACHSMTALMRFVVSSSERLSMWILGNWFADFPAAYHAGAHCQGEAMFRFMRCRC